MPDVNFYIAKAFFETLGIKKVTAAKIQNIIENSDLLEVIMNCDLSKIDRDDFRNFIARSQPDNLVVSIISITSDHSGVSISEICEDRRDGEIVFARHIAMYLLAVDAGLGYSKIATILNKSCHSTVCNAMKKFENDPESIRKPVDEIRKKILKSYGRK